MSYELHITRVRDWTKSSERPIALHEWLEVVNSDPELIRASVFERSVPNAPALRIRLGEGGALWTGHRSIPEGIALRWKEGRITTTARRPDKAFLRKFKALARALDAHVIGDEGEEY